MKSHLVLVACLAWAGSALGGPAQITETAAGTRFGTTANQGIGFHGAAPTVQRSGSAQAAVGTLSGNLAIGSLKTLLFTGRSGTGTVTVTGLASGDVVTGIINLTDTSSATTLFSGTVAATDTLVQTDAGNYSAKKFLIVTGQNSSTDATALKTLLNELRAALVQKGLIKGSN